MTKKEKKAKIDIEKCKGCMLCVDVCPQDALETLKNVNKRGTQYVALKHDDKCNGCGLCVLICPDCAIEIEDKN